MRDVDYGDRARPQHQAGAVCAFAGGGMMASAARQAPGGTAMLQTCRDPHPSPHHLPQPLAPFPSSKRNNRRTQFKFSGQCSSILCGVVFGISRTRCAGRGGARRTMRRGATERQGLGPSLAMTLRSQRQRYHRQSRRYASTPVGKVDDSPGCRWLPAQRSREVCFKVNNGLPYAWQRAQGK